MASPRIPLVKKISNEVFQLVQKSMTPAQRDGLSNEDWVRVSGQCDQFALELVETIDKPDTGANDENGTD